METTAREIAQSVEDDRVKAYALFLLGVVGIELDFRGAMQFLAKEFKAGELPIGLADLRCASRARRAQKTGKCRQFSGHSTSAVHTLLKGNRSLRATLDNMFVRPIGPRAMERGNQKSRRLPRS